MRYSSKLNIISIFFFFIIGLFLLIKPVQAVQNPTIYWGAYINGAHYETKTDGTVYKDAPYGIDTWDKFEVNAGKKVSLLQFGLPFKVGNFAGNFPSSDMEKIRNRGAIPFIGWGSWEVGTGKGVYQPEYKLTNITKGDFDPYIRKFAQDAKAWGKPFFLNLNHEQNLSGQFPWQYGAPIVDPVSGTSYSNTAADFVASWRHVHDIFTQEGVTNVTWVWAPHPAYGHFTDYYPGSDYVDYVGTGTLNYGPVVNWGKWWSFDEILGNHYSELAAFNKPMMLTEFASLAYGGDRNQWYNDALRDIPLKYPLVKSVLLHTKGTKEENLIKRVYAIVDGWLVKLITAFPKELGGVDLTQYRS